MITKIDMLSIVEYLKGKEIELEVFVSNSRDEGDVTYMSYEIISDNVISIDSGWNTHEEGGSKYFIVTILDDKINVNLTDGGYSVYGGDFNSEQEFNFNTVKKFFVLVKR